MHLLGLFVLLLPPLASAAELNLWPDVRVRIGGDFIGGYFHDEALMGSWGRETQSFKMSRGILSLDVQHHCGFGGLLEYDVFPDEARRDSNDKAGTNFDWYNNLGTDLYYYGDFKVRNGYLRYLSPEEHWLLRFGRMVNIIGFEEDEVPFWGRLDSPHAHFLTKEILNGAAIAYRTDWLRIEIAALSGRGRPDSDYNWYLDGKTDPNTSDNSWLKLEGEAQLHWRDNFLLSAGYHTGKTGSAPGSIYSGKHNDDRLVFNARLQTDPLGPAGLRVLALGQYSKFTVGLTEDGVQGNHTERDSRDLDKDGWFATGGLSFFERLGLYVTYEEIDRVDSLVWYEVAKCDPQSEALDSIERSTIFHADFRFNPWISLYGFYRKIDFDFPEISKIRADVIAEGDYDKYGVVLRVKF